jgi:hypothetical protein
VVDQGANVVIVGRGIPTSVIGGGTVEIQMNTIATFVLGLPRR